MPVKVIVNLPNSAVEGAQYGSRSGRVSGLLAPLARNDTPSFAGIGVAALISLCLSLQCVPL